MYIIVIAIYAGEGGTYLYIYRGWLAGWYNFARWRIMWKDGCAVASDKWQMKHGQLISF